MRSLLVGALLAILFVVPQSASAFPADFDGDGKADPTIWRPSTGVWYVRPSNSLGTCPSQMTSTGYGGCYIQWGLPGDKPITGDFDADGKADFSVWRPSNQNWYIRYSSYNGSINFQFPTGNTNINDVPDEGDVNQDGRSDIVHFRKAASGSVNSFYARVYANNTLTETLYPVQVQYSTYLPAGNPKFYPATGNYANQPNLFSNDEMAFAYLHTYNNDVYASWCWKAVGPPVYQNCTIKPFPVSASSTLVTGDFGGNVSPYYFADFVDWYPINGIWNVFRNGSYSSTTSWGNSGDIPMGADYTGDSENDYVVFRPDYNASGYSRWFFQLATCLPYMTPTGFGGCYLDWGLPGDVPVA